MSMDKKKHNEEAQEEAVFFFFPGLPGLSGGHASSSSSNKTRLFDHDKRCQKAMTYWVISAFVLASDGIAMREVGAQQEEF